jgi:phosphatidate cytidylyltransferase
MKTRVLSGLLLAPLLVIIVLGDWVLLLGCMLIGLFGIKEFYNGFHHIDIKPSYTIGFGSVILLYIISALYLPNQYYMLWFFAVILSSVISLFDIEKCGLTDAMATLTGILYVVFLSYHIVLIDQIPLYNNLLWLVIITAFGTDTLAYFSGYVFGKHKLCPKISPKKTIEGAIGGALGSIVLCGLFGYFLTDGLLAHCLIIGFIGSIAAQLGDLTASLFKRKMGIKDYGNLIPGHGGILDRFDSVLFTAPLVYYYIVFVLI